MKNRVSFVENYLDPLVNESDLDRKYISVVDKSARRIIFDGRNPGKII